MAIWQVCSSKWDDFSLFPSLARGSELNINWHHECDCRMWPVRRIQFVKWCHLDLAERMLRHVQVSGRNLKPASKISYLRTPLMSIEHWRIPLFVFHGSTGLIGKQLGGSIVACHLMPHTILIILDSCIDLSVQMKPWSIWLNMRLKLPYLFCRSIDNYQGAVNHDRSVS